MKPSKLIPPGSGSPGAVDALAAAALERGRERLEQCQIRAVEQHAARPGGRDDRRVEIVA